MKKLIFAIIVMMITAGSITLQAETTNRTATQKTEQVTNQATDQNPVVGQDKKGRTIHQGSKGGLYYWAIPKTGKNAGKAVKRYLSKADKEEFYKSHPQVKRPTNN